MAISVDSVYKTVLSILNKEQRGFLPPNQFNQLAKQAQLDILDNLFYDYNQALTLHKSKRVGEGYADIIEKIEEQIDAHYKEHTFISSNGGDYSTTTGIGTLPSDLYKTVDLSVGNVLIEKINKNKLSYLKSSPLTKPSATFPVYHQTSTSINVDPVSTAAPTLKYIKVPADPKWGFTYSSVTGGYEYSASSAVDFELHPSKETDLIIKILSHAGVVVKDATVIQVAQGKEVFKEQKQSR